MIPFDRVRKHTALVRALASLTLSMLAAGTTRATVSEQVPIGPRAIAMGGAFTSLADDATALFWNPAGLARIGHQELSGSHANLFRTGIRDNDASFVLPLSPDQAAALDWYHSGFDDGELGFRENRVTLGWSLKLRTGLWAGASAKLLTRGTDLDGTNLRSGRGYGMDFGLLAAPIERLHLGAVAQDAFDTRVRDTGGSNDVAYPHNLRLGASYAWKSWATTAFDVDDRWHFGAELTPVAQLALRVGAEDDRHGSEGATWTYGVGAHAGVFRVDWARVQPPTLDATDHFAFAMEFNFNPAQVRIEKVQTTDLYTSLYKSYALLPFGTAKLRNLQDRSLETRVSVYVPEMMDAPSEQTVQLRPHATTDVPLTAVFDARVLTQRGDQPVRVQVGASYQSRRLVRKETSTGRALAYAPGAIDWSAGTAQAAAFVTPRDPAVDAVAREASRDVALSEHDLFGNRNVSFCAAMTDALQQLGVAYVPDPNNPFASISETPHAVDTIHYPYQTLERRSGDCDDTTVLLASLLGNVGVSTCFVDAPGHIFLVADTGLHARNRAALGVDSTMSVVLDEEVWIPIETTALGKGFAEAWRRGAEEVASWSGRGQLAYVDVGDAQSRYEPVSPPGERRPQPLDMADLSARLASDAHSVEGMRSAYYAAAFGAQQIELESSLGARLEVARITLQGGDAAGAVAQLQEALRTVPQSVTLHNDLGVALAALDSLDAAEDHWHTAITLGATDAGTWLNLGLLRWARGDSLGALEPLARGMTAAGGYAAACHTLGLPTDDAGDRTSSGGVGEIGTAVRAVLRAASTVPVSRAGAGVLRPTQKATRSSRAPSLDRIHGLSEYLHWTE